MITELLRLATTNFKASVADTIQRAVAKAALMVVGGVAGIVALGFLTAAGYSALRYRFTAPEAQVIVALIYLVIAAIFIIAAVKAGKPDPMRKAAQPLSSVLPAVMDSAEKLARGGARPAAPKVPSPTLAEKAHDLAEDQVRKLPPYQRISAALISGYLIGRVIDRRLDK